MNLYRWKSVIRADLTRSGSIRLCRCDKNIQILQKQTRCDMLVLLSSQTGNGEGVKKMTDIAITLFVTVMGGVVCHYIIKWLDSGSNNDN